MAFTAEEELSIVKILGVTPSFLDAHLASLGVSLTVDIEDAVRTEIARWETAGSGFVKLHPKESNKGVETYPDAEKGDIRRNIATLLEIYTYSAAYAGMGTLQIGT